MKYRLLDFLACPDCGEALRATVFKEVQAVPENGMPAARCDYTCGLESSGNRRSDCSRCYSFEIEAGVLECKRGHIFPVAGSIPRMLPDAFCALDSFVDAFKDRLPLEEIKTAMGATKTRTFARMQKNTQESFGYQWLRYDFNDEREDREIFLSDSQLSEIELRGKVVLDAGCGMGRYTRVAGQMGGEVIGIDLSVSVLKAHQKTGDNPCVHILQGDLLNLPFREKQFDIIYSLGVIHHTPDPRKAVTNLSGCLKEGGTLSIWVYGTAGTFRDFITNPLRGERKHYVTNDITRWIHWFIVGVRELLSNTVRLVTTRMYIPLLYLFCYPLAALGKVPLLKYLTASVHRDWRVRLQENFDWFSPRYQSHHSKEEVAGWFDEVNLSTVSVLEHGFIPKVGLKGIKDQPH